MLNNIGIPVVFVGTNSMINLFADVISDYPQKMHMAVLPSDVKKKAEDDHEH